MRAFFVDRKWSQVIVRKTSFGDLSSFHFQICQCRRTHCDITNRDMMKKKFSWGPHNTQNPKLFLRWHSVVSTAFFVYLKWSKRSEVWKAMFQPNSVRANVHSNCTFTCWTDDFKFDDQIVFARFWTLMFEALWFLSSPNFWLILQRVQYTFRRRVIRIYTPTTKRSARWYC